MAKETGILQVECDSEWGAGADPGAPQLFATPPVYPATPAAAGRDRIDGGIAIGSSASSATALANEGWSRLEAAGRRHEIDDGEPLKPAIRVLLVRGRETDDAAIGGVLSGRGDFEIAADVGSGEEALMSLDDTAPDVVLIDHRLPSMSAAATCRAILGRSPGAAVAVLAPEVDDASIRECLKAGARAYVLTKPARDLADAIRAISRGERWLGPEIVDRLVTWTQEERRPHSGAPLLSHREKAVLALLAGGKPNREIAERLEVSPSTVKATIASILRKLRAKNRTEAVSTALRLRIL